MTELHSDMINKIHAILNEYDGEEALKRIREVLYGTSEKTDE